MLAALAAGPVLDIVASIGGLIIPPAFDFFKKKFVPASNDTPERTIGSLAMTKPEALEGYGQAMRSYLEAKVGWFRRDVTGSPSQWVIDLRAAIRPIAVCLSFAILILTILGALTPDTGVRLFCETTITSWMGSRLTT